MLDKYSNLFSSNILSVESTQLRSDIEDNSKESLIKCGVVNYYAVSPNANFTLDFKKSLYVFTKFKIQGIIGACSPYCWDVYGSLDNIKYSMIHSVNRALCNTSNRLPYDCSETFFHRHENES